MGAVTRPPHDFAIMANALARHLRNNATPAERSLWQQLRLLKELGHHFRRQVPIGPFVVDFADFGTRLVIEVDGGQHTEQRDAARTAYLVAQNFAIVRFWNYDVLTNLDGVMETILARLKLGSFIHAPCAAAPHPGPPREGEGE